MSQTIIDSEENYPDVFTWVKRWDGYPWVVKFRTGPDFLNLIEILQKDNVACLISIDGYVGFKDKDQKFWYSLLA